MSYQVVIDVRQNSKVEKMFKAVAERMKPRSVPNLTCQNRDPVNADICFFFNLAQSGVVTAQGFANKGIKRYELVTDRLAPEDVERSFKATDPRYYSDEKQVVVSVAVSKNGRHVMCCSRGITCEKSL